MQEWYINRAEGLQQGWTVEAPPEGASKEDGLRLDFAVRGGLAAQVSGGERDIAFVDPRGATVLTYGGLVAWDADGAAVPVRFVAGGDDSFAVEADTDGARFFVTIDPVAQQAYLKASNTGAGDQFGFSVSISGDTVVVGAPEEDSAATGVNGDGNDYSADDSGAVYVFERSGMTWSQHSYLKSSNTDSSDRFGSSVSADDDTVVVGAPIEDSAATGVDGDGSDNSANFAGAAYLFDLNAPAITTPPVLDTAAPAVKILKKKKLKKSRPRHTTSVFRFPYQIRE